MADGPAEQRAALQTPGQAERAAQSAAGLRVTACAGQHALPEVAAVGQHSRYAAPARNSATASPSGHQRSPPNGRICWPQPIGDSQAGHALSTRRPLGSGSPGHVADPGHEERHAEDSRGQAAGATGARGELAGDRGDAGEGEADSGDRRPGGERTRRPAARRRSAPDPAPAARTTLATRHDQGGGQAGVPADDGGADQLGPAGLLALPGVPHHGERAHQGRRAPRATRSRGP